MLQQVDDWIAAGTIDGEQLNAADFQIAPASPGDDDSRPAAADRVAAGGQASRAGSFPTSPAICRRSFPRSGWSLPPLAPARPRTPGSFAAATVGLPWRPGSGPSEPPALDAAALDGSIVAAERAGHETRWPRPEAGEGVGEAGAVGQRQLRVELEQRGEDEAAAGDLAVGQGEALGLELEVAEQQQVDVERARAVAGGVEGAAALGLDPLAEVEQLLGLELGADADRGVEEVGLVEDLADRLGLVGRGDRLDLDPALAQQLDRRPQVGGRGRRRWSRARGSRRASGLLAVFLVLLFGRAPG